MDSSNDEGGDMATPDKDAPVGEGGRFAALKSALAKRKGVSDPAALAASIGRRKYGKKAFGAMSKHGK